MSREGQSPEGGGRNPDLAPERHLARFLPAFIGAAIAFFLFFTRGGMEPENSEEFWHILCDALFVPGVFLTGAGLLVVVSAGGAFDALKFAAGKLAGLLKKEEKRREQPGNYYEYVAKQREKTFRPPASLLATGVAFLAAAAVALVLYTFAAG